MPREEFEGIPHKGIERVRDGGGNLYVLIVTNPT